jgi:hypothetical protein
LGYKDLSGAFRPGKLAEVLVEASRVSKQHKPYFICLDEMNLARVEHYFSDMLSVLETQEWLNDRIVTTPLIHRDSLQSDQDKQVYGNRAGFSSWTDDTIIDDDGYEKVRYVMYNERSASLIQPQYRGE